MKNLFLFLAHNELWIEMRCQLSLPPKSRIWNINSNAVPVVSGGGLLAATCGWQVGPQQNKPGFPLVGWMGVEERRGGGVGSGIGRGPGEKTRTSIIQPTGRTSTWTARQQCNQPTNQPRNKRMKEPTNQQRYLGIDSIWRGVLSYRFSYPLELGFLVCLGALPGWFQS